MRIGRFFVAALFLVAARSLSQEATPAASDRQADLARLQGRIGTLKARLAESEKKEATLAEELKRLELKLEIATREGELVAATREDFARRLAAVTRDRAAASASAAECRRLLLARARLLQRFGRYGYFRVLLEARDLPAFLASIERLDSLARRDGRLLGQFRFAEERLAQNLAREQALKGEIDRLYARGKQEETRMASLKVEREKLLAREQSTSASRRREVSALTDKVDTPRAPARDALAPDRGRGGGRALRRDPALEGRARLARKRHDHRNLRPPPPPEVRHVDGFQRRRRRRAPRHARARGLWRQDRLRPVAGRVRQPRHPGPRRRHVDSLRVAAVGFGQAGRSRGPSATRSAWRGMDPGRDESGVYFEVRDRQKASDPVAWLR